MPPLRISVGGLSETWAAPARDGIDSPLILERSLDHLGDEPEFLQALESQLRALGSLAPPFRPFIEVSRSARSIEVLQERFIGVSGRQLVQTLWKNRRLLPIDVWLTLAVGLCRAWASVSRDSLTWPLVPVDAGNSVGVGRVARLGLGSDEPLTPTLSLAGRGRWLV